MKKNEAKKLEQFFDAGHKILISSSFVDGFVNSMFQIQKDHEDYDLNVSDEDQEVVYSSDVFSDRPLSEVSLDSVSIYKEVEFDSKIE